MARGVSLAIGIVVTGLGVWAVVAWWASVMVMLRATVAVVAVLVGLGIILFALSDLWTGQAEAGPPPAEPQGIGDTA